MSYDYQKKYICPRLLDYILIVGTHHPNRNNSVAQTPELLRRYPRDDHTDFPLPPDVVFFCQPEGCFSVGPKRLTLSEYTCFVFTLTDKDSGKSRYGICMNFFRTFERRYERSRLGSGPYSTNKNVSTVDNSFLAKHKILPKTTNKEKSPRHVKNNTLTSFCILSHHPFFSMFRECLFMLKQIIESCSERSSCHRVGGSKNSGRDTVWGVLTGFVTDNCPNLVMHEVREIETWIFRLLSAPVPVPSKTRVEVKVLPLRHHNPLVFAMPDHTRFSLVDFPLHLPLELLGVDTCLRVLSLIMLENKMRYHKNGYFDLSWLLDIFQNSFGDQIIIQSRDYNALSKSVMAFVAMLYPLEYMFPVIPLLPTCMSSAEQLLLVPTPYIIGIPASFLMYKKNFQLPDDVWLVDLDSNKIMSPSYAEEIPELPEPEGSVLKNHLKQALASMSVSPQPIKDIDELKTSIEFFSDHIEASSSNNGFNPLIYGNDVDSVDVATRVAMVRFFNSPNILGNFAEHTRTLRLFPRPVVAFQLISFLRSRPVKTKFTSRLAKTQAVEYFVEWALNPTNAVFLRVQTGIFDPLLIGDKAKWFSNSLQKVEFSIYDEASTLASALEQMQAKHLNDSNPTDESGSDSDGAESTSSSYSSLSDFVTDIQNSDINGDTPSFNLSEKQVLAVDESKVFQPPSELQVPDDSNLTQHDSTTCIEESDDDDNDDDDDDDSSEISYSNEEFIDMAQHEDTKIADEKKGSSEMKNALVEQIESVNQMEEVKDAHRTKIPPKRPPPPNPAFLNRVPSLPPYLTKHVNKSTTKQTSLPQQRPFTSQSETVDKSSIINSFTGEINTYAQSASNTLTEFLGDALKLKMDFPNIAGSITSTLVESDQTLGSSFSMKTNKPFTPLGNKKALIEKSVLVKHANIQRKSKTLIKQQSVMEQKNIQHSENQQFLKEVSQAVLEGRGIGWLKMGRVKKLMEDENYRNFVVSRLNTALEKKLSDESQHLEDVCVSKQVFKGMLTMLKALICGLEVTYQNQGTGGMASAMMILEIAHTHYWEREGSSKSDTSNQSLASSPFGSNEALSTVSDAKTENKDDVPITALGSPVVVNGDEFENIELQQGRADREKVSKTKIIGKNKSDVDNNNVEESRGAIGIQSAIYTDKQRDSSGYASESGDMLREMVKNKELLENTRMKNLIKTNSLESDVSDFSLNANTTKRKRSNSSFLSSKSHLSGGYRYREGRMHNLNFPQQECTRNYLFEMLIGKDRSNLWDQIQFWEDVFLDAVAQERDIVGMDQGPNEMMERYKSLNDSEKKRLECDEDHLLGCMLYNMISFMVMMSVNKNEIKRKVRRLLGKCHIGLSCSFDINQLLDQIESLVGNDIDLKPLGSRLMQKQSFTVHWGPDNTGDMLFMEVCDDCLILRSVNGAICDRWWYEKLINMTYCPKTKVFCLWRKHDGQTQLNKFYTKKCKELYNCVKSSMEKAASKNNGKIPGLELGSEFPVHDLKSGQGGLLQVCMEGIGLLFANSKLFIELCRIKKCFTVKGGIFVLEEFDPKSRKVVQRRYKSSMAAQICYAVLCIFSYVAAGMDHKAKASVHYNAVDNRPVTISISGSKTL